MSRSSGRVRVGGPGCLVPLLAVPVGLLLLAIGAGVAAASLSVLGDDDSFGPWWHHALAVAALLPMGGGIAVMVGWWGYALVLLPFLRTWLDGHLLVERGLRLRVRRVDLRTARVRFRRGRAGVMLVLTDAGSAHVVEVPAGAGLDVPGLAEIAEVLSRRVDEPDVQTAVAVISGGPLPPALLVDENDGNGFVRVVQGVAGWSAFTGGLFLAVASDGWDRRAVGGVGVGLGLAFLYAMAHGIRADRQAPGG